MCMRNCPLRLARWRYCASRVWDCAGQKNAFGQEAVEFRDDAEALEKLRSCPGALGRDCGRDG